MGARGSCSMLMKAQQQRERVSLPPEGGEQQLRGSNEELRECQISLSDTSLIGVQLLDSSYYYLVLCYHFIMRNLHVIYKVISNSWCYQRYVQVILQEMGSEMQTGTGQ